MRIRKCVALGGAILIFLGCLIIYRMADYTLYLQEDSTHQFHTKHSSIRKIIKPFILKDVNLEAVSSSNLVKPWISEDKSQCEKLTYDVNPDIQMSEVYKELKFDNVDGGAWKQGWNIKSDPSRWNSKKKLQVFVVPHSHNDPGWLKTFEDYYTSETRNILSNMLKKLTTDPKKKFIWAEISFFSLWWDELSEGDQDKVRRLIDGGQLEIVTGGWVMNDEANTHYYSMITQLTEGHQWMKANIKVLPKNGWTIDPFGLSPVMPYLLKKAGLENLVIHRVHYSVKKYLAQTKNLEFRWRQCWDKEGSADLFTHMTPFYSYDVPHTCGPDPKICCQFDFKRLPGTGLSCPWGEPPKVITKKNVAARAGMLLDQYRKKSELFKTNVILAPLGDDFRYQHAVEWDDQFENYYRIMNYINTNPELNAQVKFGTLADFFKALTEESPAENFPTLVGDFFTYADRDDNYWSGYYTSRPFYKRMDRIVIGYHRGRRPSSTSPAVDKESTASLLVSSSGPTRRGLYTTGEEVAVGMSGGKATPWPSAAGVAQADGSGWVSLDLSGQSDFDFERSLQLESPSGLFDLATLTDKAAEVLFALGWTAKGLSNANWLLTPQTGFAKMLRDARRSLSLFQHHDGVTGTARDSVMEDYARKMMDAINYSQHIIQQVSHFLLSPPNQAYLIDSEQIYFDFDEQRRQLNALPQKKIVILAEGESKTLVFFNSLTYKRKELASIRVSSPFVDVQDLEGNSVPCQASPVFSQDAIMEESLYEIAFVVEVPALGLASYKIIVKTFGELVNTNTFSKVKVFNSFGPMAPSKGFEDFETADGKAFSLENERLSVAVSENGLIKSVTNKKTMEFFPMHLNFVRYLSRPGKERSGAYLFLPEGEASYVRVEFPLIRFYEGPIFSRVEVKLPNVRHFLTLYNSPDLENLGIDVVNVVDILSKSNYELAMRVTTHVKSGDEFFTDLNGFQMIKRKRFSKLPLQGNFYPMPTASYIEDEKTRLTILSAQPLGVSSLKEGELEVLQDRRLNQDDLRGLGQGVLDNKITPNAFRILIERRIEKCDVVPSLLSLNGYSTSQSLLNPIIKMIWKRETQSDLQGSYAPVVNDLGRDLHLLIARTLDEEEVKPSVGLVFHRQNLDYCFADSPKSSDGVINLNLLIPNHFGEEVKKTSLSFLKDEKKLDRNDDQLLCHLDFLALILS